MRQVARTGLFVHHPRAKYAGERDPITQEPWDANRQYMRLQGDPTHFFEWTPRAWALERNPLTRQDIDSIDDWEPIVHPGTRYKDYEQLVRDLAGEGWDGEACVQRDLRALRGVDRKHKLAKEADVFWAKQRRWVQDEREMRCLASLTRRRRGMGPA